jgi:hypothetical protein
MVEYDAKDFLWPPDIEYHCAGRNGIVREMVSAALWDAKAGCIDSAAATLSQALWPRCRLKQLSKPVESVDLSRPYEGLFDGDDNDGDETRDVEYLIESAYEDIISKRIPEAIANLEEALYPDGIPAYVRAVERA